jgi:hypothetical protein
MSDLATLTAWHNEAIAARHKLLTGKLAVEVQRGQTGKVSYNQADLAKLNAYIADLAGQIRAAGGSVAGARGYRRIAYFG